jgi:hypothetical protein
MFSNAILLTSSRPLYNPVGVGYISESGYGPGPGSTELINISANYFNTLQKIHDFYGLQMQNRTYYNIPTDYDEYVQLYVILQQIQTKTQNSSLLLLLKIAEDALVGAINSYTLYGENLVLNVDKSALQQKVNDILSNKNEKFVEVATATGQLTIVKTFKLAAVFNYYIIIYGMPAYGVGFDPTKINFLVTILEGLGVDPFK